MNLEPWRRKCGIPSREAALLGDLEGEESSQPALTSSSYDLSKIVPDFRRITYGGDYYVSDEMDSLSDCSVDGDAAHFSIGDAGMGILLMVPRAGASSY